MPISEVVPGIQRMWFPGIDNNAFLIAGDPASDEPTLVDVGPPGGLAQIASAVRRTGLAPRGVGHVAVTHHHTDHTGSLARVAAATGATVYAGAADSGIVREGAERPRGSAHGPLGRLMLALPRGSSLADPAAVHVEVADGQEIPAAGGLRCLHTPGHTRGHVSYLLPGRAGGVLFVGDAAANMLHWLDLAPLNEDLAAARASFARLAELEYEVACFGHGSPIRHRAAARFRRRVERVAGGSPPA